MSIFKYNKVYGKDLGPRFWIQDQLNLRLGACMCVTYEPNGKIMVGPSRPMRGFPRRQYDREMDPELIVESYVLECVFS